MNFSRVFQWLVPLVIFIVAGNFLNFFGIIESLLDGYSKESKLFWITGLYLFIVGLYLFLYAWLVYALKVFTLNHIDKSGEKAIQEFRVNSAVARVKFSRILRKIFYAISPVMIVSVPESSHKESVWSALNGRPKKYAVIGFVKLIFVLLAISFGLACYSLKVLDWTDSHGLSVREWVNGALGIRLDIAGILSSLPVVTALIALVPTFLAFYFYNQKRDVRKIISNEENKRLEEAALAYEKLVVWIDRNIKDVTKNYDNIINRQDSVIRNRLVNRVPNYPSLTTYCLCPPDTNTKDGTKDGTKDVDSGKYRMRDFDSNYYAEKISGVDELTEIIDELLSPRIISSTKLIAMSNSNIWSLYYMMPDLRSENKVNRLFYLEDGIKDYVSACSKMPNKLNYDELEEEWRLESSAIARNIYDNLKKIDSLRLGAIALKKYLYPSRTEQVLVKIFRKEK